MFHVLRYCCVLLILLCCCISVAWLKDRLLGITLRCVALVLQGEVDKELFVELVCACVCCVCVAC